jgi:hypothetical protein
MNKRRRNTWRINKGEYRKEKRSGCREGISERQNGRKKKGRKYAQRERK